MKKFFNDYYPVCKPEPKPESKPDKEAKPGKKTAYVQPAEVVDFTKYGFSKYQ